MTKRECNKKTSIFLFMLLTAISTLSSAVTISINDVEDLSFGELTGFVGSCFLDYETEELVSISGSLCAFNETTFGTPGRYVITANPNALVRIQFNSSTNIGNGLGYIASGIYRVSGEVDVNIIADTEQIIQTNSSGIITILFGGTLSSSSMQNLNSTINASIEDGLEFSEL